MVGSERAAGMGAERRGGGSEDGALWPVMDGEEAAGDIVVGCRTAEGVYHLEIEITSYPLGAGVI